MNIQDVIIDTDPGHDDAMAMMLAIKSGRFNIKAITTVAGNSIIQNTTRNARYILKLLDREDIPIFSGKKKPLKRNLIQAVFHGKSGLEGIDPKNPPRLTNNAVRKMIKIVKKNPGKITLITLGPLTNIASAIKLNPEGMKKLKQIIMMGGAINVPGNQNMVAEFNIFTDPEAADIVFNFPAKKTLVPLDSCNNIRLYLKEFRKIANEKIRRPLLKMVAPFIRNCGVRGAFMYDALAVYYLINPSACKVKEYNVFIETKGELTRGMTVIDYSSKPKKKNIVSVIERISASKFKRDFIRYLSV